MKKGSKKVKTDKVVNEVENAIEVQPVVEQPAAKVKIEKRGRPVDMNSPRQKRLAEMKARAEANGGMKRGRPVDVNSERYKRIAEREAKKQAGIEIKRGRPAIVKVEDNKGE